MGGGRQTTANQPGYYTGFVIPRRGIATQTITSRTLPTLWSDTPLRLLSYLPDIHPSVGLALWNALCLTCAPGDLRIIAQEVGAGNGELHEAGTERLEELWETLPNEIGGLSGLQEQLTSQALLTGMICAEAVPGPRGAGVGDIFPVDSLSIAFKRNPDTDRLIPHQRQIYAPRLDRPSNAGYVELSTDTFFWRTVQAMVDEPYGRAPYAPAIAECLADMALMQDLRDAIRNAAWPRLGYGFNFEESYRVGREVLNLQEPALGEWVNARFQEVIDAAANMKADDNMFYDQAGGLQVIEGGKGFAALNSILTYLRQRIVQSLKTLPTLMGINDGSTQTYTTVEWAIYAKGLESVRKAVVDVILSCANLHLRLLGLPLKAVAEYEPIRTTDSLIEANTETVQIQNEKEKIRLGWSNHEESSMRVTGSPPVAEPMPGALDAPSAGTAPAKAEDKAGANAKKKDPEEDPEIKDDEEG
jgi:hypothetical protein